MGWIGRPLDGTSSRSFWVYKTQFFRRVVTRGSAVLRSDISEKHVTNVLFQVLQTTGSSREFVRCTQIHHLRIILVDFLPSTQLALHPLAPTAVYLVFHHFRYSIEHSNAVSTWWACGESNEDTNISLSAPFIRSLPPCSFQSLLQGK